MVPVAGLCLEGQGSISVFAWLAHTWHAQCRHHCKFTSMTATLSIHLSCPRVKLALEVALYQGVLGGNQCDPGVALQPGQECWEAPDRQGLRGQQLSMAAGQHQFEHRSPQPRGGPGQQG